MFNKFIDKILSLSGSYKYYKSECVRLNDKCDVLEGENRVLQEEIKVLLSDLNRKQDKLYSLYNENDFVESSDKIVDAFISMQNHVNEGFNSNKKLLES